MRKLIGTIAAVALAATALVLSPVTASAATSGVKSVSAAKDASGARTITVTFDRASTVRTPSVTCTSPKVSTVRPAAKKGLGATMSSRLTAADLGGAQPRTWTCTVTVKAGLGLTAYKKVITFTYKPVTSRGSFALMCAAGSTSDLCVVKNKSLFVDEAGVAPAFGRKVYLQYKVKGTWKTYRSWTTGAKAASATVMFEQTVPKSAIWDGFSLVSTASKRPWGW